MIVTCVDKLASIPFRDVVAWKTCEASSRPETNQSLPMPITIVHALSLFILRTWFEFFVVLELPHGCLELEQLIFSPSSSRTLDLDLDNVNAPANVRGIEFNADLVAVCRFRCHAG